MFYEVCVRDFSLIWIFMCVFPVMCVFPYLYGLSMSSLLCVYMCVSSCVVRVFVLLYHVRVALYFMLTSKWIHSSKEERIMCTSIYLHVVNGRIL